MSSFRMDAINYSRILSSSTEQNTLLIKLLFYAKLLIGLVVALRYDPKLYEN